MRPISLALALCWTAPAHAVGEASTHFQVFVPANNDNNGRDLALIVTSAYSGTTTVDIVDDNADGDSDDTVTGISLDYYESYVLYIKEGAVNDDAGGTWDGDYFIIDSDHPVTVQMASDSNWQHDWAPASTGKSNRGKTFVIWSPPTTSVDADINVFAYDNDTQVTVEDITVAPSVSSGITSVDALDGVTLISETLNAGQDIWTIHEQGIDILDEGHTYLVRATKPVTVQYGHLAGLSGAGHAKDGGGFVPGESGGTISDLYYFTVPHNAGNENEKELRIVSYSNDAAVRTYGWAETIDAWNLIDAVTLDAYQTRDIVGATNSAFRNYNLHKVEVDAGKDVVLFEANWMETGSFGTSDYASSVSSAQGTGAGTDFVAYLGPPGLQNRLTSNPGTDPNGYYVHVWAYSAVDGAVVQIEDLATGGTVYSDSALVNANEYHDFAIPRATYESMDSGNNRPYVHVTSSLPISVVTANNNDNFMAYITSPLPPTLEVTLGSTDEQLVCGDSTTLTVTGTNTLGAAITDAAVSVTLPEGIRYDQGSSLSFGEPTTSVINADNLNVLTWNVGTISSGASVNLQFQAEFLCEVLNSCLDPRIASIETEVGGFANGSWQTTVATVENVNVEMLLNPNNYVSYFNAFYNEGLGLTEVTFTVDSEDGAQMWSLDRALEPDGARTRIELSTSAGATSGSKVYLTTEGDQTVGVTYYYYVTTTYPNGCELSMGPKAVTPLSSTSSGVGGGLESNGRLSSALARRAISHAEGWDPLRMPVAFRKSGALDAVLPRVGPSSSVATDATPWDLPDVTNASDVSALDYVDEDNEQIASLLVIQTEGELYEHNKPVCDRASGARILDVRKDLLGDQEREIVRTRLAHDARRTHEWSSAISVWQDADGSWTAWSGWHTDVGPDIPSGATVYNVQAWAGKAGHDLFLVRSFLDNLGEVHWSDTPAMDPTTWFEGASTLGGDIAWAIDGELDGAELHAHLLLEDGKTTEVVKLDPTEERPLTDAELPAFLDVTLQLVRHGAVQDSLWISDGVWSPYDDSMWGGASASKQFDLVSCDGQHAHAQGALAEPDITLSGCATAAYNVSEYAGVARYIGGALAPLDLSSIDTMSLWVDSDASFELCAVDSFSTRSCTTHDATPDGAWVSAPLPTGEGGLNDLSVIMVFTQQAGVHAITAGELGLHDNHEGPAPAAETTASNNTVTPGTARGCGCNSATGLGGGLLLLPMLLLRRRD